MTEFVDGVANIICGGGYEVTVKEFATPPRKGVNITTVAGISVEGRRAPSVDHATPTTYFQNIQVCRNKCQKPRDCCFHTALLPSL